MYSPSTYTALDTKVERRWRRRVYRCSSRKSSILAWIRSKMLRPIVTCRVCGLCRPWRVFEIMDTCGKDKCRWTYALHTRPTKEKKVARTTRTKEGKVLELVNPVWDTIFWGREGFVRATGAGMPCCFKLSQRDGM